MLLVSCFVIPPSKGRGRHSQSCPSQPTPSSVPSWTSCMTLASCHAGYFRGPSQKAMKVDGQISKDSGLVGRSIAKRKEVRASMSPGWTWDSRCGEGQEWKGKCPMAGQQKTLEGCPGRGEVGFAKRRTVPGGRDRSWPPPNSFFTIHRPLYLQEAVEFPPSPWAHPNGICSWTTHIPS